MRRVFLARPFVGPGRNYSKSYDGNRSAIQYCWWPETCWWLGEIIRKVMTKTDLPYNTAGYLGHAGEWGKLFEKLCRKQICHTILLVILNPLALLNWPDPLRPDLVFINIITFGKLSLLPKNGLGRRPSRFLTICAKKSGTKIKYWRSYSNSTTQITPCGDPPCT